MFIWNILLKKHFVTTLKMATYFSKCLVITSFEKTKTKLISFVICQNLYVGEDCSIITKIMKYCERGENDNDMNHFLLGRILVFKRSKCHMLSQHGDFQLKLTWIWGLHKKVKCALKPFCSLNNNNIFLKII